MLFPCLKFKNQHMIPGLMYSQSQLAEDYNHMLRTTGIKELQRGIQSADAAIYSGGYRNCNGCILFGLDSPVSPGMKDASIVSQKVVLTHYGASDREKALDKEQVESYLSDAVSMVLGSGLDHMVAAVLAGDNTHFQAILDFIRQSKIPIFGAYCDCSPDDPYRIVHRPKKDLVVTTDPLKALIRVNGQRYLSLT